MDGETQDYTGWMIDQMAGADDVAQAILITRAKDGSVSYDTVGSNIPDRLGLLRTITLVHENDLMVVWGHQ